MDVMRDYETELNNRIEFIRGIVKSAGARGIVFGNSGGKDCALAGILCKLACEDTVGIMMPCGSKQNYGSDKTDAVAFAEQFGIETRMIDLTGVKEALVRETGKVTEISDAALANIAPRLRMTALYTVAASEKRLVAGTGNRSEIYMGYFTKWGDGAYDFNPIGDLTVTEVYEFLHYLKAPVSILEKVPSAGLFEGQTDESEMGITYKSIDEYLLTGAACEDDLTILNRYHSTSEHKRKLPVIYNNAE